MLAAHGIIGWLVVGLIVGAVAKLITGERDASGCLVTIAIGIAGALFAGWAGSHLFHLYRDGSNPGSFRRVADVHRRDRLATVSFRWTNDRDHHAPVSACTIAAHRHAGVCR